MAGRKLFRHLNLYAYNWDYFTFPPDGIVLFYPFCYYDLYILLVYGSHIITSLAKLNSNICIIVYYMFLWFFLLKVDQDVTFWAVGVLWGLTNDIGILKRFFYHLRLAVSFLSNMLQHSSWTGTHFMHFEVRNWTCWTDMKTTIITILWSLWWNFTI